MMFSGPCYETRPRFGWPILAPTRSEYQLCRAIVCAHCGIPVIGISCITNFGAGILEQPLNHKEVVETAARVKKTFVELLDTILEEVIG
ncbi:MAG: hypothetical protein ACLTXS_02410 [[Clostridium] symbiosum]